jgi:hypothetical protein
MKCCPILSLLSSLMVNICTTMVNTKDSAFCPQVKPATEKIEIIGVKSLVTHRVLIRQSVSNRLAYWKQKENKKPSICISQESRWVRKELLYKSLIKFGQSPTEQDWPIKVHRNEMYCVINTCSTKTWRWTGTNSYKQPLLNKQ